MSLEAYRTLARLGARREEWARAEVAAARAAAQAAEADLAAAAAAVERCVADRPRRVRELEASTLGRVIGVGELERWRARWLELADEERALHVRAAAAAGEVDARRRTLESAVARWQATLRAAEARDRLAHRELASLLRARERRVEMELDDEPARPA